MVIKGEKRDSIGFRLDGKRSVENLALQKVAIGNYSQGKVGVTAT